MMIAASQSVEHPDCPEIPNVLRLQVTHFASCRHWSFVIFTSSGIHMVWCERKLSTIDIADSSNHNLCLWLAIRLGWIMTTYLLIHSKSYHKWANSIPWLPINPNPDLNDLHCISQYFSSVLQLVWTESSRSIVGLPCFLAKVSAISISIRDLICNISMFSQYGSLCMML